MVGTDSSSAVSGYVVDKGEASVIDEVGNCGVDSSSAVLFTPRIARTCVLSSSRSVVIKKNILILSKLNRAEGMNGPSAMFMRTVVVTEL